MVSRAKSNWYKPLKSQEISIKFTVTDCFNFEKRCSGAHFVSFLFYYYCNYVQNMYLKDDVCTCSGM